MEQNETSYDQFILSALMLSRLDERASLCRTRVLATGFDCLACSSQPNVGSVLHCPCRERSASSSRCRDLGLTVVAKDRRNAIDVELYPTSACELRQPSKSDEEQLWFATGRSGAAFVRPQRPIVAIIA